MFPTAPGTHGTSSAYFPPSSRSLAVTVHSALQRNAFVSGVPRSKSASEPTRSEASRHRERAGCSRQRCQRPGGAGPPEHCAFLRVEKCRDASRTRRKFKDRRAAAPSGPPSSQSWQDSSHIWGQIQRMLQKEPRGDRTAAGDGLHLLLFPGASLAPLRSEFLAK